MKISVHRLARFILRCGLSKPAFFGRRRRESIIKRLQAQKFEVALDIGSGPNPRNEFNANIIYGLDIRADGSDPRVLRGNIASGKLPFEDASLDCVTAYHVLEHIPRVISSGNETIFPFVNLMNEIWRVLKVNGVFFSITPCYPFSEAFQDPTHVNICTENTLSNYFGEKAWARIYGFHGAFVMMEEGWCGSDFLAVLEKSQNELVANINYVQNV